MRAWTATVLALIATGANAQLVSETPRAGTVCTDGIVDFAAEYDGALYIAGKFANVGPLVGAMPSLDPQTALADPALPLLNGSVIAVAPDGEGGLYVSGDFDYNADGVQDHLIRILADGSIGPWAPKTSGVYDMARDGNYVYLVGSFAKVDNKSRTGLARVDAVTGALDLFWLPYTEGFPVRLLASGNMLVIAGSFTKAGGQARDGLAAYDLNTGALLPWDPITHGDRRNIVDIAASGNILYIVGYFELPGQPLDRRVAAINLSDGSPTGWGRTFYNGTFSGLAVRPDAVYLGGHDVVIGGKERIAGAALAIADASVRPWNPEVMVENAGKGTIEELAIRGSTAFLVGRIREVAGQPRFCAAAVDLATGAPTPWNPALAGGQETQVVLAEADRIVIGGKTYLANTLPRSGVAAIDLDSGQPTAWAPLILPSAGPGTQTIRSVVRRGEVVLLAGGGWASINGIPNGGLATVDAQTGSTITSFKPGFDASLHDTEVDALHLTADTLYACGQRPLGQNQIEKGLFVLDAQTGERQLFTPRDWPLARLVAGADGRTGFSIAKNSELRELSLLTGEPTFWVPDLNGGVSAVAVAGSNIFIAGGFTKSGDQNRNGLAAFGALDDQSRKVLPWDPAPDNGGNLGLVGNPSVLYVSGVFNTIGGAAQKRLAALDPQSGLALLWAPVVGANTCGVLFAGPGGLVVGDTTNDFTVGGVYRRGFAVFPPQP